MCVYIEQLIFLEVFTYYNFTNETVTLPGMALITVGSNWPNGSRLALTASTRGNHRVQVVFTCSNEFGEGNTIMVS